jgi:hypothetical protein
MTSIDMQKVQCRVICGTNLHNLLRRVKQGVHLVSGVAGRCPGLADKFEVVMQRGEDMEGWEIDLQRASDVLTTIATVLEDHGFLTPADSKAEVPFGLRADEAASITVAEEIP